MKALTLILLPLLFAAVYAYARYWSARSLWHDELAWKNSRRQR